ncbi:MAG: MFS transporter [Sphingomonadales bacterium]|nr:MAG: MFS transporter [Sphingomonadales bacterium]
MSLDPRAALERGAMRPLQVMVVALCIAMNALDGFDVLAISFAAPGIAKEWGIDPATLGIVLSMELFGMAAGSVLIGNAADRMGRRPTILGCLAVMAAGMFGAAFANNVETLLALRLVTGIGIGGMLSSTSAMVAEFSNARRRSLNVALNIAGYSTGAILGGLVASGLLADGGDWRSVFLFGGAMTAVMLPLALLMPESLDSLIVRRPPGALKKINATLGRLRIPSVERLPPQADVTHKPSIMSLFGPRYARITIQLTIAYFAQIMLFYYVQKWVPKIVVDMGFAPDQAAHVLVAANIGNLLGALLIAFSTQRVPLRPLIAASMVAGFIAIGIFGQGFTDINHLALSVAVAAFFVNASVVGLYPVLAQTYPSTLRASGIGFVIGVGRGGSALGPVIAGALFAGGSSLMLVSIMMGIGALVAAAMILTLPMTGGGGAGREKSA